MIFFVCDFFKYGALHIFGAQKNIYPVSARDRYLRVRKVMIARRSLVGRQYGAVEKDFLAAMHDAKLIG